VQAEKYLIDNYHRMDEITVDELLQFVTGPDFPTGAQVLAGNDLKEAYATGRGKIVLRARVEIEEDKNESYRLVFTEIPYQIGKSTIVERIVALVREGRLEGVSATCVMNLTVRECAWSLS
jgi:DNA gyrase subunit A